MSEILKKYNVTNYRYDVVDDILFIKESMEVKAFVNMRNEMILKGVKPKDIRIVGR